MVVMFAYQCELLFLSQNYICEMVKMMHFVFWHSFPRKAGFNIKESLQLCLIELSGGKEMCIINIGPGKIVK